MKKTTLLLTITALLTTLLFLIPNNVSAQLYMHEFGTDPITSHPYTVTPDIQNADISNSEWTNNLGLWVSYLGESGQAIGHASALAGATVTLNFDIAPGKELEITSFNFWRKRSPVGAQSWAMTINGIDVGNGSIPSTGAEIGTTTVANPVTGLTGNVTIVITLSNAIGSGWFALDNFTLNGTLTDACIPPTVTLVSPQSGPAQTVITIEGIGFESGTGTSSVQFNGMESNGFTVISDTTIKAVVPTGATSGDITVLTDDCEANAGTFTVFESDCPDTGAIPDLFISELYDYTPGSFGVIELYNPTPTTITFNGQYTLERYGDIGTASPSYTKTLNSGSIAPFSTILLVHNDSNNPLSTCPNITVIPDFDFGTGFNGNDEFKLKKNNVLIDIAHAPTNTNYTVIREADATAPSPSFISSDWSFSSGDCSTLGTHSITLAAAIATQPESTSVCENDNAQFSVSVTDDTGFTYQWKTLNDSGNWVNLTDDAMYSGTTTNTLTVTQVTNSMDGQQFYCEIESAACTLITDAAQLTVSPLPLAIVIPTQPTCTTNTGSIEITASIGDDLTYSLDGVNFQTETTFTSLAPGNYTLYIESSTGCSSTMPFEIEDAPDEPAIATTVQTQPTCTTTTGSIEVTAPLGANLEYSLNGIDFQTGTTFNNLTPGTYQITVQNSEGCVSVTPQITINDIPTPPAVATVNTNQPTCSIATGSIEITAPLGGDLEYSIDGTNFQSSTIFNNLTAGIYTITVKNAADCTSTTSIVINDAPETPVVATVTETQPDCTTPTGSIEVTAPLGSDLEYSIDGTTFQSSTTFDNLSTGTYTITVRNNDGCTSVTETITINPSIDSPDAATTSVTQPDCATNTGSIEITAPLAADLEYSIDGTNFQTGTTFDNLTAGTYTVTVKNAANCTSTVNIVIDDAPDTPAVATTIVTQPDCTTPTGSIEVTAPLAADLEYSIDGTNFQSATIFGNLTTGTYTVTVRNNDGCTSETATITIDADSSTPDIATITETQPDCTTATGTIEVTAPLGGDLEYSIDGTNFQSATTFDNLTPGTYNVIVRNSAGCISTTTDIVINTVTIPTVPIVNITQATCNVSASIEVTAPLGTDLEYSIDGVNFQSNVTFNDVNAGTYTVTVRNNDGCTATSANVIIDENPQAEVATYAVTQPTCSVQTGTIEVITPIGAGYSYSIDGTNFQSARFFTNLQPGQYTITLENADGCISVTETIVINNVPTPPTITGVQGCAEITGGALNYLLDIAATDNSFDITTATITWTDENSNNVGNDIQFNVTEYVAMNNINDFDYPIEFTATVETASGCETSYTFSVDGILCTIPRGISPNNDNQNDNFDLTGLNARKVSIFNRYGKEVYSRANYTNEWNGQADNGDELPTGTYFYVVETNSGSKTGWVYVNRQEN